MSTADLSSRGRSLLLALLSLSLLVPLVLPAEPVAAAGNHKLPTPPGASVAVPQGNNMGPTHYGSNAWAFDFLVGQGTPIYASRAGYVRMIKVDSNIGGCNEAYYDFANYIVIDHQDGSASLYLHLQQGGTIVTIGQFVQQSQHIGYSGATGYVCGWPGWGDGAHLHYAVQDYVPGVYATQSRPLIFADHNHPTDNGVPPSNPWPNWWTVISRNYGLTAAKFWYFAEGYTGGAFDEYLTILNPNPVAASITITYNFGGGPPPPPPQTKNLTVGANSRFTVAVHDTLYGVGRNQEVSVRLISNQPIIVERPMYFNYYSPNVGWADGGHNAVGVTPYHDPGQFVWWFAEGWTGSGFAELITVQNPNDLAAYLTFTYFRDNGQPPIVINESVNGLSRRTFDVRGHVGANQAVSLKLQSDRMVNVERPMYFNYYGATTGWADGGHNAVGAVTAEYSWYFAEGTTRPGFDQYLTIQNPGNAGPNNPSNLVAAVEVTYRTASGGQFGPYTFYVQPKRRITLAPRDQIGWDQDFATEIKSSLPIVAERPMYFTYGAGGWKGGHVVMGLPKPEYRFYFAEGWTGSGFDEFVALFNTHSSAYAFVTMQYMFPDGGVTTKYVYIAPKTRQTINVNAEVEANQAVSIKVTSDMPIIAERMMYFNYYSPVVGWADGGHVAVGYSP